MGRGGKEEEEDKWGAGHHLELHHQRQQMWYHYIPPSSPVPQVTGEPPFRSGPGVEFQIMAHLVSGPSHLHISVCYDHIVTVSHKSPPFLCCVINLSISTVLAVQVPVGWFFFTARCRGVRLQRPRGLTVEH